MTDSPRTATLDGRPVSYRLRHSPRARRLSLRLTPEGPLLVKPRRASLAEAERFLHEHAAWLLATLARQGTAAADRRAELGLRDGLTLLRGEPVPLTDLPPPPIDFLRRTARADVLARLSERAGQTTRGYRRVTIRAQRTRWGSCSTSGTLSFNYRLIHAPPPVLDYLVAHELAHLDVPNHSRAFWRKVESLCPTYRDHEAYLKHYGSTLLKL